MQIIHNNAFVAIHRWLIFLGKLESSERPAEGLSNMSSQAPRVHSAPFCQATLDLDVLMTTRALDFQTLSVYTVQQEDKLSLVRGPELARGYDCLLEAQTQKA